MTTLRRFFVTLAILVAGWSVWAQIGRVGDAAETIDSQQIAHREIGGRSDKGNLLGIQPWLRASDYANAATLSARLDTYLVAAAKQGLVNPKTIAVFPEYTGTWLVASNEKRSIYGETTVAAAMQTLALTHLPDVLYRWLSAPDLAEKLQWALFTVKGDSAARDYQSVFGELAKRHQIHVVGGSIVLPEPTLVDGRLTVRPGGSLYNVTAVFAPDGGIVPPLVIKVFPIADELKFTTPGTAADLPVFATPAGKLAVLICADAWYPSTYARLTELHAELIVVPSYSSGNGLWATKWGGYNGAATPSDVDSADVGKITEGDAWLKYPMPRRAPAAGIHAGLNVFLRGELWDLGSDGTTIHVNEAGSGRGELVAQPVLTSLWLQ